MQVLRPWPGLWELPEQSVFRGIPCRWRLRGLPRADRRLPEGIARLCKAPPSWAAQELQFLVVLLFAVCTKWPAVPLKGVQSSALGVSLLPSSLACKIRLARTQRPPSSVPSCWLTPRKCKKHPLPLLGGPPSSGEGSLHPRRL